jgi:hypothetical protein
MSNLPKFLFVGTAKAGTTSIYHYLNQHPDIAIPFKETFYFLRDVYANNKLAYPMQRSAEDLVFSENDYLDIYRGHGGKVCGEIGTGYLYHHKESIPLIKSTLGADVKILIILRHPTSRCFSSYMHFVKDLHETIDFQQSLDMEEQRSKENWDFMWHHRAVGCYSAQVHAYLDNFKHVKVMIYEEFTKNPDASMREIFSFIDVAPNFDLEVDKQFNPSGTPKYLALQRFITQENPLKKALRPVIRAIWGKEKREQMRKGLKAKNLTRGNKIDQESKAILDNYYRDDIQKLEKLIGREIIAWKA